MRFYLIIFLILFPILIFAQPWNNTFSQIWQDSTWGQGTLTPTGPVWSIAGGFDFDNDGYGEFLYSSSWSGTYKMDAGMYEWTADNKMRRIWYQWYYSQDSTIYNYSNIKTGDLDADGVPEIIVFVDAYAGQDALFIYEYDRPTNSFPSIPTATWNLNLGGGVDEASSIQIANIDSDVRPEIIVCAYSRNPAESHFIIAELAEGSGFSNPVWNVELDNTSEMDYYSYLCQPTDLDQDGKQEVIIVEWNYCRMLIFENTSEDNYAKVNDLYLTFEPLAFSNEGAAEANFNNDNLNELYIASTAGYVWVVTNSGDVSQITYNNNFHLLKDYMSNGAYILSQLIVGNADSPIGSTEDNPDIYIAAVDTNGVTSTVFDLEYNGGTVTSPASYSQNQIFSQTNASGKIFKPAKMAISDLNNNGSREIVISSFGLDVDMPHFIVLESDNASSVENPENPAVPSAFELYQNFPNPFNASTQIRFELKQSGNVSLRIYDITGKAVATLLDEWQDAGEHQVNFDANSLASGNYYCELQMGTQKQSRKMQLIK